MDKCDIMRWSKFFNILGLEVPNLEYYFQIDSLRYVFVIL
jgi:hypothetical protein